LPADDITSTTNTKTLHLLVTFYSLANASGVSALIWILKA